MSAAFNLPPPDLQVGFALKLIEARSLFLQDALREAVKKVDIELLDGQLVKYAPKATLTLLASHGFRGELVFPTPVIFETNPRLLAYYRLLYGYSQKLFYGGSTGLGRFKNMEENGVLSKRAAVDLTRLCEHMGERGEELLAGIGATAISDRFLDDLTLLTLGPQWRGGANVDIGTEGIEIAFGIIRDIVQASVAVGGPPPMEFKNAAGQRVIIQIKTDPDICIEMEMSSHAASASRHRSEGRARLRQHPQPSG